MSYARLIRPVIDRVYAGARWAALPRMEAFYAERGVTLGFENSLFSGVLARPVPARALTDALVHTAGDMSAELAQGVAVVDAEGAWHLTGLGRELALFAQRATAEAPPNSGAPRRTSCRAWPRYRDWPTWSAGCWSTGWPPAGPAFQAMTPAYEPDDASPALRLVTRLARRGTTGPTRTGPRGGRPG